MNIAHFTFDKAGLTLILSASLVYLGRITIPILILLAAITLDFFTGLKAAKYRAQEIDSTKFSNGIKKKVLLLCLVGVGILIDLLLYFCVNYFDLGFSMKFAVAIAITVWLIVNEIISILENLKDSGVPIPPGLMPLIKNIKSKVEKIPIQLPQGDHIENIECLTDIVARQSVIIRELHNTVKQLNATTSLEGDITDLQADIDKII